jgi:hypothetical protein
VLIRTISTSIYYSIIDIQQVLITVSMWNHGILNCTIVTQNCYYSCQDDRTGVFRRSFACWDQACMNGCDRRWIYVCSFILLSFHYYLERSLFLILLKWHQSTAIWNGRYFNTIGNDTNLLLFGTAAIICYSEIISYSRCCNIYWTLYWLPNLGKIYVAKQTCCHWHLKYMVCCQSRMLLQKSALQASLARVHAPCTPHPGWCT